MLYVHSTPLPMRDKDRKEKRDERMKGSKKGRRKGEGKEFDPNNASVNASAVDVLADTIRYR